MNRIFVSYSVTGDAEGRAFVRRLLDRLGEHDVEPWIFESPAGQIPAGASIADACRQKIDEADAFLVFLSAQAIRSAYVALEVAHALVVSARRPLSIVPLVAVDAGVFSTSPWKEVRAFRGLSLPPRPADGVEDVVLDLTDRLGIPYVPAAPSLRRLPLARRVAQEVERANGGRFDIAAFGSLRRKCERVVDAMTAGDYARARHVLQAVLTDLSIEYGMETPYYPRVAYGVALLGEAHAGRATFAEAESHFTALIAEAGPLLDANAYGGRAHARVALGKHADALADYLTAEARLDGPDPATLCNLVQTCVVGRLPLARADIERRRAALDAGIVSRVPGDLDRLTAALALAWAYIGDRPMALSTWTAVQDPTVVAPELVTTLCDQLRPAEAALQVLSRYLESNADLTDAADCSLHDLQARLLFERGETGRARQVLDEAISRFPSHVILLVDAAMFAVATLDLRAAHTYCADATALIDPSQCRPAVAPAEFNFALGQAFWMQGRHAESRESFRRSGYPASAWYEGTLPGHFAACGAATGRTAARRH